MLKKEYKQKIANFCNLPLSSRFSNTKKNYGNNIIYIKIDLKQAY